MIAPRIQPRRKRITAAQRERERIVSIIFRRIESLERQAEEAGKLSWEDRRIPVAQANAGIFQLELLLESIAPGTAAARRTEMRRPRLELDRTERL